MVNFDKIADKIFSIIKGYGHDLIMYAENGNETSNPEEGRWFFVKEPNYMISLGDEDRNIKFNRNKNIPLEELEPLIKHIKQLGQSHMLNVQIKALGQDFEKKPTVSPADFSYEIEKKKGRGENMDDVVETVELVGDIVEASLSRLHGSTKTSYQTLESVKVIIRHRQTVDEEKRGSRSRAIQAIFLERAGERFRFPHNYLPGARAMARHMYEGGDIADAVGQHIVESTGDYIKLREFYKYARTNKLINENSEDIISVVKENIDRIKDSIGRLTGAKSYGKMKEQIEKNEKAVLENETDDSLVDLFTVKKFDEKIGDILPLVNRLVTEKSNWKAKIEEASKNPFQVYKEELSEEEIMEFENPMQRLGYKIKRLSERASEEGDIAKFVARAGNKLIEGETLSEFEKTVVRNVLENVEEVERPTEEAGLDVIEAITESFAKKLSKYDDRVLFESYRSSKYEDMPYDEKSTKAADAKIRKIIKYVRANPELFPGVKIDGKSTVRNLKPAAVKKHLGIDLKELWGTSGGVSERGSVDSSAGGKSFQLTYNFGKVY
jgi:hypothetical protein